GMEVEVACRYQLPITFIVVNNNGIGGGPDVLDPANVPPSAYTPQARYDKVIEAFGGKGYFVTTPDELTAALDEAMTASVPTLVNVMIDARSQRKQQEFAWLTR